MAVDVDATFTMFHVSATGKQINPDFSSLDPYPSELLYDRVAVKNADVIIWTYPNNVRTMSWGGSAMFDLVPHALKLPTRGFCDVQAHWFSSGNRPGAVGIVCHEFSHALQSRARNPMIDVHYYEKKDIWLAKWRPYGYTERDEISTFLFQFRTFIPEQLKEMEAKGDRRGWQLFSYAAAHPCRITREAFEQALRVRPGQ